MILSVWLKGGAITMVCLAGRGHGKQKLYCPFYPYICSRTPVCTSSWCLNRAGSTHHKSAHPVTCLSATGFSTTTRYSLFLRYKVFSAVLCLEAPCYNDDVMKDWNIKQEKLNKNIYLEKLGKVAPLGADPHQCNSTIRQICIFL